MWKLSLVIPVDPIAAWENDFSACGLGVPCEIPRRIKTLEKLSYPGRSIAIVGLNAETTRSTARISV